MLLRNLPLRGGMLLLDMQRRAERCPIVSGCRLYKDVFEESASADKPIRRAIKCNASC